jgi:hypothetical protein
LTVGRVLTWWLAAMGLGGLLSGALSAPGMFAATDVAFALVALAFTVAVVLAVLHFGLHRPLRELVLDPMLLVGCAVGLAAFLVGQWLGAELAALR